MAGDIGEMKSDMKHVKSRLDRLEKQKPWYTKMDWGKFGKGAAYFLLSLIIAAGGVGGISAWLGFFR
jgi:hypothetical protein